MLRALLYFDLPSLFLALQQDAAILAFIGFLACGFWLAAQYSFDESHFAITEGLVFRRQHLLRMDSISVLEIVRPLSFRILHASRVILYFKTKPIIQRNNAILTV